MKRITLRLAAREDWPRIVELHREHQAAQGTAYELPWLFGPSIALALVGVDEEGTIRKKWASSIEHNAIHGSDAEDTARFELSFFFAGYELAK